MENIVAINLHGHLGEAIGKEWKLAVKSVREAIHAINILTKNKLYRYLLQKDKEGAEYTFKLNSQLVKGKRITQQNKEEILKTEIVMENDNLESIDIIPIIEGADKDAMGGVLVALGVILIIVGAFALNPGIVLAGLTLVMGGISMLLSKSPKFEKFGDIKQEGARSYFFGGAINIISEGGPVPLGYGEALVGSQVISAGFSIGVRTDSYSHYQNVPSRFYPLT